jgi:hypothetical protein
MARNNRKSALHRFADNYGFFEELAYYARYSLDGSIMLEEFNKLADEKVKLLKELSDYIDDPVVDYDT